jgi:hypothetical protein
MTAWTDHVKKTFAAGKKKNDKYTYKQAMTDAAKTYKKTGGSAKSPAPVKKTTKAAKVVDDAPVVAPMKPKKKRASKKAPAEPEMEM